MAWRYLRPFLEYLFRPRRQGLTFEDLGNMDLACEEELTVFDLERMQIDEEGEVYGTTALIKEDDELTLSGGKLPAGYGPNECD
jgi:hypothetical protein